MDSPYPDLLEINEQRLRVVTRTASELQAQMEHLHKLRNRLARASICRLSQQATGARTNQEAEEPVQFGGCNTSRRSQESSTFSPAR
jgi:hypothetical protein